MNAKCLHFGTLFGWFLRREVVIFVSLCSCGFQNSKKCYGRSQKDAKLGAASARASMPPSTGVLTPEQMADLRVVYSAMDRDSDGCVTAKEMLESLRTVQASSSIEDVQALMAEIDLKTPGQVTWDEFVLVMEKKLSETTSEAQLFELLDANGNGTINPAELKASLLRFGLDASDQTLDEMIRAVDLDGDGVISLPEFKAALQS